MSIVINGQKYKSAAPTKIIDGHDIYYSKKRFLYQTEAIFQRAKMEGFQTPDNPIKEAINEYIGEMIKKGIWDKYDDYLEFSYGIDNTKNLITFRNDFSSSTWNTNTSTKTVNTAETLDPWGENGAMKIDDAGASDSGGMQKVVTANATGPMTFSMYTKSGTAITRSFRIRNSTQGINHSTGVLTYSTGVITGGWTSENVGNGWYRLSQTITGTVAGDQFRVYFGRVATPTGNDTWYIWGVQAENGSTLTPFEKDLTNFTRINWKRPFDALTTIFGGMALTAEGWKSNGVDAYINTNYNPTINASKFELNNHNVLHGLLNDFPVNAGALTGIQNSSPSRRLSFFPRNSASSTNIHYSNDFTSQSAAVSSPTAKRLVYFGRTSSSSRYAGANGNYTIQPVDVVTPLVTGNYYIGGYNNNNVSTPAGLCNGTFTNWGIGMSFDSTDANNSRLAYNNYLTKLGLTPFV